MQPQPPILAPRSRRPRGSARGTAASPLTRPDAERLAGIGKALADATRLQVVAVLREAAPEALTQVELVDLFDVTQPAVAKHLGVLVRAGLVATERRGAWTYYFLPDPSPVGDLSAFLG